MEMRLMISFFWGRGGLWGLREGKGGGGMRLMIFFFARFVGWEEEGEKKVLVSEHWIFNYRIFCNLLKSPHDFFFLFFWGGDVLLRK